MTRREIFGFSMFIAALFMLGVGVGLGLMLLLKDAAATIICGLIACLVCGLFLSLAEQANDH